MKDKRISETSRARGRTAAKQIGADVADIGARAHAIVESARVFGSSLDQGQWTEALEAVRALRSELDLLASIAGRLEALERSMKEHVDHDFLEVETIIRQGCDARGWRVDGQWPKLFVEYAIPVAIDEGRRAISVGDRSLGPATAKMVVAQLESIVRDLIPRNFTSQGFMVSFAKAYDAVRDRSTQLPILRVYRQMVIDQQKTGFWTNAKSDAFVGMSIDQFRARFTRLLREGVTTTRDGRYLRLLPPLDPKDAIFIYQPAEARFGYIGRVEFVPADSGEN